MTVAEQARLVAHLDWATTTAVPTLQWSEAEPAVKVSTSLEMDRALHKAEARATAQHAIAVAIYGRGHQITIGLGLPQSFVSIRGCEPGGPQPCVITVGSTRAEQGAVFFFLGTHRTEIPQRNLIPAGQARQILREFLETGSRPTSVDWENL